MLTKAEKDDAARFARNGTGTWAALGRHEGAAATALTYLEHDDPGMAALVLKDALEFSALIDTLQEARCTSS